MDSNNDWGEFECEIMEIATTFAALKTDSFSHKKPKEIVHDLEVLDKALTVALQKVVSLRLEHQEGQDVSVSPFNWPVVTELSNARMIMNAKRGKLANEIPAYPSDLIKGLFELRDAAHFSIEMMRPGRGNSERRNSSSARMADLAKNFVFRFRRRFGHMPPKSKTGPAVELLRRMFEKAGEVSNDAAEQLRQAIEKDTAGLQSARVAKAAKRAK